MIHSAFDISAASVALAMAVVLACVKMPGGEQWRAMRRMNSLLIACYSAMGISNVVTALCGVSTSADQVMCAAMLIVSMFQAMLFTATCAVFVSPQKISVRWLTTNALAITLLAIAIVYTLCQGGFASNVGLLIGKAAYVAQLVYYCRLFKSCYDESLRRLETSYDEDMRGSLRLVKSCFIGALTVGLSALLYVVLHLGDVWYNVFTCIYSVYYIYLVICVINYRICSGYIVKVVAAQTAADAIPASDAACLTDSSAQTIAPDAEQHLVAAIDRWVNEKQFVRNDLTVEEIAAELGTTHTMLKWYFTNRMHTTFRSWRLDLRVEEAKRLLRDEDVATSAVHTLVGVADKSNFHKLFSKQVGMTPREYKKSCS